MDMLRYLVAPPGPSRRGGTDFTRPVQQDPGEFLQAVLDRLESELQPAGRARLRQLLNTTVRQELACCDVQGDCPDKTSYHNHPQLLALPMKESSNSLEEAMGCFLGLGVQEIVQVQCGYHGCTSGEAEQSQFLHELPGGCLIIQLKRFGVRERARPTDPAELYKLDRSIRVPVKYQPKSRGPVYVLTGALLHMGPGLTNGHYVSVTRDVYRGKILLADDDMPLVELLNEEAEYAITRAYMLMYVREEQLSVGLRQSGDTAHGRTSMPPPPPPVRPPPLPAKRGDWDERLESEDMETDLESSWSDQVCTINTRV